jgi:hypothetical protein
VIASLDITPTSMVSALRNAALTRSTTSPLSLALVFRDSDKSTELAQFVLQAPLLSPTGHLALPVVPISN